MELKNLMGYFESPLPAKKKLGDPHGFKFSGNIETKRGALNKKVNQHKPCVMNNLSISAEPLLEVEEVSYAYGKKKALDSVGFKVLRGHCHVLLGPNGAGKTTLFSLITHLFDCTEGVIKIAGINLRHDACSALAQLGTVFQQSTLDLDLTVWQNLSYHTALHGLSRKTAEERIKTELERLDLSDRLHDKVRELNGGHRRRVEIARALLHQPQLLLLDEPTVGLDVPSRTHLVKHVHSLAREGRIAVLWTTHLIDEVQPDDRLIILDQGKIKATGTVEDILHLTGTHLVGEAFSKLTMKGEATWL